MLYLSKVDKENQTISILNTSKGLERTYPMSDIQKIKNSKHTVIGIDSLTPCLPALKYGKEIIRDSESTGIFERETAIMIIDGNWYENDNHQFCLEEYLKDSGTSLKEKYNLSLDDDSFDTDIEKVAEITHSMFNDNEAFGFDIYRDRNGNRYLAAHFEENLVACYDLMKNYAQKNNLTLCIEIDFCSDILREVII
jgi:hypothetical protein